MKAIITSSAILIAFLINTNSFAQVTEQNVPQPHNKNNYIGLNIGQFFVHKAYVDYFIINAIGINYTRNVYKDWQIDLSYSQWINFKKVGGADLSGVRGKGGVNGDNQLHYRKNYRMIDVSAIRMLYKRKHHLISAGLGLTYYWGDNYYSTDYYYINHPSFDAYRVEKQYWGICPQLSYKYNFWSNRLATGILLRARHILSQNEFSYETNLMFTLGYNF